MRPLLPELRAALLAILAFAVVCCGIYPLIVFGLGQLAFRDLANGSLIVDGQGGVRGSQLLGQAFTNATYFHPRPSAAGIGYDATDSGGSNLGPTSQALRDTIGRRVAAYRAANEMSERTPVPADAVTASGSGLDPHISPANARRQVARVAAARKLSPATVAALVERAVEPPQFGFLGERRVNVLLLNRALDAWAATQ
jgi:K+-transporting ATPase ATPase C chain